MKKNAEVVPMQEIRSVVFLLSHGQRKRISKPKKCLLLDECDEHLEGENHKLVVVHPVPPDVHQPNKPPLVLCQNCKRRRFVVSIELIVIISAVDLRPSSPVEQVLDHSRAQVYSIHTATPTRKNNMNE